MAAHAMTITEARNRILRMINAYGSGPYQQLVLDHMNSAQIEVIAEYDWEFLRAYTTVTMPDATGVVDLPDDVDRILSIHEDGADYFPIRVTPLQYEQYREDDTLTDTVAYTVKQMEQDTTTEVPHMEILFVAAPAADTVYRLWYSKHVDQLTEAIVATSPNLPPQVWDLVVTKATWNVLAATNKSADMVRLSAQTYERKLAACKRREDIGHVQHSTFGSPGYIDQYYAGRH